MAKSPKAPLSFTSYALNKCLIGYGVVNGIINAAIFAGLHAAAEGATFDMGAVVSDLSFTGLLLGMLLFEDRLNGVIGLRQVLPGSRQVTAHFTEEDYRHTTLVSESTWHYEQIQAVCETEAYFLLLLGRRHGQVYSKAGFTRGTPEAFRTFIAEKTGLGVPYIR